MSNVYSPYKAAHHLDRIKELRDGKLIYPTQIQIDLTNLCNHKCLYCFSEFTVNKEYKATFIDVGAVLMLLDDAVRLGVKSFHYTGGGEPFLHKDIYSILERTLYNNLEYGMVTNGTLINFNHVYTLERMSWIRISVDASDAKMYYKLRKVNEFDEALRVIGFFSCKCPDTVLGLSFVINPTNYHQIYSFAKLAKGLGADNVRYSIAWFPKGWKKHKYNYEMKKIAELMYKAEQLQTKDFKVFNLTKGRLNTFNAQEVDYKICGYQHFTTVIGADSVVYPCCTLKYLPEASFGNLKEHGFEKIWEGDKRYEWLNSNYLTDVCSKNICWMQEKNKFIGYLIENNPKHVNFI